MGFRVHVIPVSKSHGVKRVSSTRIRKFIADADIDNAEKLLDRPVAIMGKVIKGDRRGKLLGYPTANLDSKVTGIVPRGVYCTRVHVDDHILKGIANIGLRPTFKKNASPNIEVHIFDFDKSLYGKIILLEFVKKIRDEQRFASKQDLVAQLHQDELFARKWFSKHF
jgi:riboflavin kinase/FMN adenylyltransferase